MKHIISPNEIYSEMFQAGFEAWGDKMGQKKKKIKKFLKREKMLLTKFMLVVANLGGLSHEF